MKKIGVIITLTALGAGSAYANDFPVPSFNDAPEIYSHGQSSTGASSNNAAASRPAAASVAPAPAMNYGPWIVIPSSGA